MKLIIKEGSTQDERVFDLDEVRIGRSGKNDIVLKALARQYLVDAIERWEKRVWITSVEFPGDPQRVAGNAFLIRITFKIIASRVEGNLVYPLAMEI